MKRKIDLPKPWVLVYYFFKFIGLAPFTVKKNVFCPPTLFGKIYPILVAVSYLVFGTVTYSSATFTIINLSLFIVLWNVLTYLISVSSVAFTPIVLLFMYNNIVYLMNKLCIVNNELKILGIKEDHEKFFKNLFTTTLTVNAVIIVTVVILFILEPHWNVTTSTKYHLENWFNVNTVLMFVQLLLYLKQRFTLVNERLFNLLTPANNPGPPNRLCSIDVTRKTREENGQALSDVKRIRKIKTLHLELCDLVNRATHVFGFPILSISIRFSVDFLVSSFWMCSIISSPEYFNKMIKSILCTVIKMIITIILLFVVTYASAETCKQGNFTKAVLFKTWIKFRAAELSHEFFMFSNQLLHTSITVSAFGFVALDYSFLSKILSIVVTYLIIMFQFDVIMPGFD